MELAIGVDAQVILSGSWEDAHVAPYFVLAWYGPTAGAWLEARLPDLPGVPVLGSSDWLRAGVTIRIPP